MKRIAEALVRDQSLALLTDLYQLTMVYGYWKSGLASRHAVFHLNFRKWPFKGGYAIAAGLETAVKFIEKFHFSDTDLEYLESLQDSKGQKLFEPKFLEFLNRFQFECDLDAMPEGTAVFPYEPLIRVKGPIWQAQLLESPLLNIVNFQTLIATKAARICMAAGSDPVIEFGMRRAQGIDGAISASRAAYIGGCAGTSDVIAGKLFDIPVRGTHAHSWVMAFEDEAEAFKTFGEIMPKNCVFLVDTYNSLAGTRKACAVARSLKNRGFELAGVRLDSGDLARLSIEIRKILDEEGFPSAQIMASNELDEYLIRDLKQQGAKITLWGVGTNLVTGKDQPALDGVYKLSAIQGVDGKWQYKLKLSEQTVKVTNPGMLQVRRFFNGTHYEGDAIYDEWLGISSPCEVIDPSDTNHQPKFDQGGEDLLVPIFRNGKKVYHSPSLHDCRSLCLRELKRLPPSVERFTNPQPYLAGLEKKLYEKKLKLIAAARGE
ncbi:MAG: nicotinate phosphoribosyltransferase [Verrucomicrobia bacterium]|nr:nicotinate phosphoribosyltransferase [Verrucomicrobiota bacterium]